MDKKELSALHDERVALLKAAADLQEVERVPVISSAQTWAIAYAGETAETTFTSVEHEFEVYAKYLKDIPFDGTALFSQNRPLPIYDALGYSPFFYSPDGVTLQHKDNTILPDDEIEEYTKDTMKYMRNKMLYRRYPALRQEFPQSVGALAGALGKLMEHRQKLEAVPQYLREHVGAPIITGDLLEPALDRYVCYRGFKNGMMDLRRRPGQVLEAVEATYEIVKAPDAPLQPFPWAFMPVVSATHLNRKQFEKFFWPTCKRTIEKVHALGGKTFLILEGTWGHVYEHLLELPKGSVIAYLENDDIIQAKKDLGDHVALVGGMPVHLLREGTKQQNIDHVRNVIDTCGTKGLMISTSMVLLSPGDVNADNLRATVEFVRDYRP